MNNKNAPKVLPGWSARRVGWATLVIALIVFGFFLIYHSSSVVISLFVAVVIGIALRPPVDRLSRHGLPPLAGAIVVYLVVLISIVGFVVLVVPLVVNQISAIVNQLPDYYHTLRETMLTSESMILWRLGLALPTELPGLAASTASAQTGEASPQEAEDTLTAVREIAEYVRLIGGSAFIALATLLLSFQWTVEGRPATRTLLVMLPQSKRAEAQDIVEGIEAKVGAYVRGQTILCVIIGGLSFIAYTVIGLPHALVLAFIAGILEAVPYIGPVLGALPAILLAVSTGSPSQVLWVVVATVIIQQLENSLFVPRVMDETVGINPIMTLLSIAAFGALWGVAGAVLAIPIAAIIQLLLHHFLLDPESLGPAEPLGRDAASVVRYKTQDLIQDLRKQIRQKDEDVIHDEPVDRVEENIEAIAIALDGILAEAAPEENQA